MKRISFLYLLMLLAAVSAHAQYQRWWGYYDEGMATTAAGTGVSETYHCAVYVSGSQALLSGATLHGIRFYLRDKTNISDVQVWLSKTQFRRTSQPDILVVDVPQTSLKDMDHDGAMTEVTLPETYTMGSTEGIYVGYSFKVNKASADADKNPIVYTKEISRSQAFYVLTSKSIMSWNNLNTTYGGSLALQMLVSNPSLPAHAVAVGDAEPATYLKGQTFAARAFMASMGFAVVNDVDYEVLIDGQTVAQRHYALPQSLREPNAKAELPVEIPMPAANGVGEWTVRLTQVNGQPNEETEMNATSARLMTVDQLAERRSVVEEYTGTWCTNCPRGMVGLQNMERDFGERFIGIAIHTQPDPMVVPAFSQLVASIPGGVPKCQMDRKIWCDPYLGDILTDKHYHASTTLQRFLDVYSEADLSLKAQWTDDAQTAISYTATTTFHIDSSQADYRLAFVLTADALTGTGREWYQVNGDSGSNEFPDADMDPFRNAPNPVTDMEYNHVAIGATEVSSGISGSIQAPLVSGQAQTYRGSFSIAGNSLVQDKTKLHAIVLLLNTQTGEIVNAAKAAIAAGSGDATGLDYASTQSMLARQESQAVYDLQGRRLSSLTSHPSPLTPHPSPLNKGIYIVNGKKIIVQ